MWDPTHEWAGLHADAGIRGASTYPSVSALCLAIRSGNMGQRLVVQSDSPEDFALWCELVYTAGDLTAVIDEAHLYCKDGRAPPHLLKLNRVSRHRRVDTIFIAQRPHGLAVDLRDQRTEMHLFFMSGEASLQWVRNECGEEVEKRLRALSPRSHIEA